MEEIFTNIYSRNEWGENLSSGCGSTFEYTVEYRKILTEIMHVSKTEKVIDIG